MRMLRLYRYIMLAAAVGAGSFAQAQDAPKPRALEGFYMGLGGGKNILKTESDFYGVSLIAYKPSLWGAEFHYRRAAFTARNLPDDYQFGSNNSISLMGLPAPAQKMDDDANIWCLGVVRKWVAPNTRGGHLSLSGGLAITDYFENQFTYTGVNVSGGMFSSQSANYSTEIDRQILPGAYLRSAFELPVSRGFSLEMAAWGSMSSKVNMVGMEALIDLGYLRNPIFKKRQKSPPRPAWRKPVPENG